MKIKVDIQDLLPEQKDSDSYNPLLDPSVDVKPLPVSSGAEFSSSDIKDAQFPPVSYTHLPLPTTPYV